VGAARRIVLATLAALPACALFAGNGSSMRRVTTSWQGDAQLVVTAENDGYPALHLALDLPDAAGVPGQITIDVPRGFPIYADRPTGSAVGSVQLSAQDDSFGSYTQSYLAGDVVALDPTEAPQPPTDCRVGTYTAAWQLKLSLLGQEYDVPVYLVPRSTSAPQRIVVCAPALPAADRPFPISTLDLVLEGIETPQRAGSYVWHALVTPLAVDRKTPLPARTYELRAVTPVPDRLTLTGRYLPAAHAATLRGTYGPNGAPHDRVPITIFALDRKVTTTGSVVADRVVGHTFTTGRGDYTVRVPIRKTTGFVAVAAPTLRRCEGSAVAPAGCRSQSSPGAQSDSFTVLVP
jgi:hypothetical protein